MTDEINVLALHCVGGRLNPEPSRAWEARYYRNPEDSAKLKGESMQRDIDEVENLLDMWADWMHKPEPIAEGYPAKASGGFIESWRKDSEDEADAAEAHTIEKIDAAYNSLQRIYQEAINRHYGLGSRVWRFAQDATFEDAKIVIRVKFVAKGLL